MTNTLNNELHNHQNIENGSIWASLDKRFKVNAVTIDDIGAWVHYTNIATDQTYNCLIDAFKSRFTQEVK